MNTFRVAPWYLKPALLLLPLVFGLRFLVLSIGLLALRDPAVRERMSSIGLLFDLASVVVVGLAAWLVWRPRPASRWVLAAAFVLLAGLGFVDSSPPLAQLPRIPANESSPSYQLGQLLAPVAALVWGYFCIFGRRALDFFRVGHAPEN